MTFSPPSNFDYSSWKDALEDKVQSACGDEWIFKSPSWYFSKQMFRNLQNNVAAERLEGYMLKQDGYSLGGYLNKRGGFLFMLIFGLILLVISVLLTLSVIPKVRNFYSKLLNGACRTRDRPRLKQIQPEIRNRVVGIVFGCSFTAIALLVVQMVASSRMLVDVKKVDCGMWMQLYGHFYGVPSLSKDLHAEVTREISWSWRGTQPLLEALSYINRTVNPNDPENPIRGKLWNGYRELQGNATIKQQETNLVMDQWIDLSDTWWGLSTSVSAGDVFNGTWSEFTVGTAPAVAYKSKIYKQEVETTLTQGWVGIERLLERYAGETSDLLIKAEAAASDAISTINQMNAVIGALTEKWDHLGPMLIRALRALGGLIITLYIFIFALVPCSIVLVMMLRSRMKSDVLPSKKERTMWGYAYIATALMAGFAALYCGLTFFLAGLGNDVCDLLEDGVFVRGQWGVLGDDILSPQGVVDVDVPRILDTCILKEGDGNVATALALDARIAELAEEVDRAKAVVLQTRETMLDRANRLLRVQIIKTGAEDMFDFIWRSPMAQDGYMANTDDRVLARNLVTEGVPAPWFDDSWDITMQPSLLCLIPTSASVEFAMKTLAYNCAKNGATGLEVRPVPLNFVYEKLNSALGTVIAEGGLGDFPTTFCSDLGDRLGFPCDPSDERINADEFRDWPKQLGTNASGWNAALTQTTFANDETLGYRTWRTILSLGRLETFMQTLLSQTNATQAGYRVRCPLGAPDCTIYDAIKVARQITKEQAPILIQQVEGLFGLVDHFVDNVTIGTMSSVVESAYDVVEGSNCQFEGTALNAAAVHPLCEAIFPAVTVTALVTGLTALTLALLGRHLWKWYHYMEDLASLHGDDPVKYDEAKVSFVNMSQRREFVELYTGVPTPERETSAPERVAEGNERRDSVRMEAAGLHQAEPAESPASAMSPVSVATLESITPAFAVTPRGSVPRSEVAEEKNVGAENSTPVHVLESRSFSTLE
eukprot:Gregarina_sp_Poly_1__1888@NODE_1491_length_4005_cov_473_002031_g987_i0_p1_GENE_NODE_1491_length_4005_cov_473_002031_g987_i0NODE_1491_length_4005_cov_473_002031_g987_i0_p1_ORF_typecomplete_len995_score144_067TM_GPCR_Srv/PF10323_9/3_37TM_GPCR_Srv/PF10323_9/11MFS_1/PF07690_16/2_1MFS_1/PF07690_16/1_4SUR7/PF06687_12/7_2SUR7/PF06687_12/7_9SUR7/PF06687_12/8_6e03DUF1129/PF06570_11/6_9e02DUF1129/PF06570_11/0_65_NODE_1491_length_4005_cov_473_002031_g987_i03783362